MLDWESEIDEGYEEVHSFHDGTIDNMLGIAYVTCQVQITAVVEAALKIAHHSLDRLSLLALGPRLDATFSKVEVLWALANYFKHRDEWSANTWVNPLPVQKRTVEAIRAAGLTYGSRENLRTGAEALENDSYNDVAVFYRIVRSWSTDVRLICRARSASGRRRLHYP